MARENTVKSKLVERLRAITVGPVERIGFGARASVPPPALLLVVVLPESNPELARAAIQGGADALEIRVSVQTDVAAEAQTLAEILKIAGDRPCGVLPVGPVRLEVKRLEALRAIGFDFAAITTHDSPAVLSLRGMARVLTVDNSLDLELLRGISELPIDCVEVFTASPEGFGKPFSLRDALRVKTLSMLVRKPILLRGEQSIQPDDVVSLYETGIEGLVIDSSITGSDKSTVESVTGAYHKAIQAIDVTGRRRHVGPMPIVPRIGGSAPASGAEPEEEPDE